MSGRWKRRLALTATALVTALLGLEVNLRLFGGPIEVFNPLNGFHEGDPELGWRGKKGIERRFHTADFDVLVRHDEEGFRAPEPPRPQAAAHRLLILGDSLGWGWGVAQGELFSDRLQRALAPDVGVYNHSVNAFSTGQELLLLRHELRARNYDSVLVVVSRTDLDDNADDKPHRPAFDLRGDDLVPRNQPPPSALKNPIERFLDDHSRALGFLSWQLAAFKHWYQRLDLTSTGDASAAAKPSAAAEPSARRARDLPGYAVSARLLREMAAECRRNGADLTLAYATTDLEERRGPIEVGFRDLVEQIASEEDAGFIDLNDPLEHARQAGTVVLIPGDGHWSAAGHRIVASALLESGLLHARQ